ncbi:esterase B1-like [Sitophilus oryzae]|uniref:Esterase B1-like n=1 Tax=Sitophilus oryzae TaxID=7048 RepID=A0A6J2XRM6_SITOR|nr:esterase B1-like [Sitophilus oryzae]
MSAVVKTLQGAVQGNSGTDHDGNTFYKFLGIPYAKPPVGDLRFRDPQPPESWIGVRDATKEGSSCYNTSFVTYQVEGSEDCLYLNVFTRNLPEETDSLKPVMVWIHGGGFVSGSSSTQLYGPEFLLTQDVVLVTINYRLGIFGFLRIKDPKFHINGNMGFKDQVAALRWVKNNIIQFNGDPNNITLFGESAGSASVHLHILSPLSSNLFHKAILQSGSALNPWSEECNHSAVTIARLANKSVDTEKEAVEYLRGISVEELFALQTTTIANAEPGSIWPFGLAIEDSSNRGAFMSRRPIDIITSGDYNKVPIIFGYNSREGLVSQFNKVAKGSFKAEKPEHFIPHNVNFKNNIVLRRNYVDKLKNLYFSGTTEEEAVISILGDAWFVVGIVGAVKNHSQTSMLPIYLYKMSLDTKLNMFKTLLDINDIPGCAHADDIGYLFKTFVTPPIEADSTEDISLRNVLKLWTNFAKYGDPTPDETEFGITWKPTKARQLNVLNIGSELSLSVNPENKRLELWRELYSQSQATIKYL